MKKQNKILLSILILFSIAVAMVWGFYTSKINLLQHSDGTVSNVGKIDENDEDVKAEADAMEYATSGLKDTEAIKSEGDIVSHGDVLNILLIGTDERTPEFSDDSRGDSCMLLSLNKKTMEVKLISFQRGIGMPILNDKYKGQWDWLTHTFRYGGADLMMKEIRECFKVDVNRYVRVNFATFEKAINAMGGIDIDITELEAKGLNGLVYTNVTTKAKVYPGINHLDGYDALQYARIRFIDDDWKRIERQRKVINEAIKQTQNLTILELNKLLNEVLPLVQTNFTQKEITSLLPLALKYNRITVEEMTMPAKGTFGSMEGMGGRRMFAVDFEKNSEILEEFIYG